MSLSKPQNWMCIIHEGVQRVPNAVNARLGGKLGRAKVAATAKTRRRRDIKKIGDKKGRLCTTGEE